MDKCSVYILIYKNKLVYIGIARCPYARRKQHQDNGRIFDRMEVLISGITRKECKHFEQAFIALCSNVLFLELQNVMHNKGVRITERFLNTYKERDEIDA